MGNDIAKTYKMLNSDGTVGDSFSQYFEIVEGPFIGTVYKYDSVSLQEPTKDGNLPFSFEYTVLKNPTQSDTSKNSPMTIFLSMVLIHFIQNNGQELISGTERTKNLRSNLVDK